MGEECRSLHLVKVQPETRSWSTDRGFPCETPLDMGSLNDAPVVWYISKGPAINRCHVTAIDIMDRRTPNLDPKVFSSTLGNIIFPTLRNAKCDQNAKFYANDNFILN